MIKVFAYQHGIYPRSEQVVASTRGLDRGRVRQDAVDQAYADDLAAFVRVQKQAGLDFFSDGLLNFQDIFRPIVEALGGKPHKLVRWFDTNTFYRQPDFSDGIGTLASPDGAVADPAVPRPVVVSLPSPFMFSRAAEAGQNRNRLMVALANGVLRPLIDASVAQGAAVVHLEEPWLAYQGVEPNDWAALNDALDLLHRDLSATLVFHLYFGDAGPHVTRLRKLPVDVIGVDLMETDIAELGAGWEIGLLAGIINGRDSRLEPVDRLVEAARHLTDSVRPRELYLSSNCELAYLPAVLAEQKVQRLGEAATALKELVSV